MADRLNKPDIPRPPGSNGNNQPTQQQVMQAVVVLAHQIFKLLPPNGCQISIPIGKKSSILVPGKPDVPQAILHLSWSPVDITVRTK